MLAELVEVATALAAQGVGTEQWHRDLKALPKVSAIKPSCLVKLSRDGMVTRIELPDDVQVSNLRKWQCSGKGFSFPTLNVRPLFKAFSGSKPTEEEKERYDSIKRRIAKGNTAALVELDACSTSEHCLWDQIQLARIDKCLHQLSAGLLALIGSPPDQHAPLASLADRVQKICARDFHAELAKSFRQALDDGTEHLGVYGMLWHCSDTAPGNDLSLLLDIDDLLDFGDAYPVQHPETIRWINRRLLANQSNPLHSSGSVDAFGRASDGKEEKLDDVKVPGLGNVILRSMNHESPCQHRYRRIGPASYPVGRAVRLDAKAAFEWLVAAERKGLTWDATSAAAERKEILLAYPSELPTVPPAMAMMITGALSETMETARFETCAAEVVSSLKGLGKPLEDVEVRVFALRKMDPARTQVSCHRIVSAAQLAQAADFWRKGCDNIPAIRIRDFVPVKGEGRQKPEVATVAPVTPFPLQVIACLNTVWSKDLATPGRAKTFAAADGVDLLLGTDGGGLLARALHAAVTNWTNLLSGLRMAELHWKVLELAAKGASHKRFAPSVLGLLLYKSRRTKENYMREAPFLVGRVMSLADELHYRYCTHVRGKSYPPQLVGNALMATAMETPVRALALLCQRVLPYQAWARSWQGEDAGLVRFFLNELRRVCDDLSTMLPAAQGRMTDTDKAELLLGYLSSSKAAESQDAGVMPANN